MSFAIQNEKGKHLGFLLMVGSDNVGDCIFRSLPSESDGFECAESELLFNLQSLGEFNYSRSEELVGITQPGFTDEIIISGNGIEVGGIRLQLVPLENS